MSFLYQSTRALARTSRPSVRYFSTTLQQRKTATDTIKDSVKQVDRTVSDAAVAGIEKGEELSGKAKDAIGVGAKKAGDAVADTKAKAEDAATDAKAKAAGKTEEVKHKYGS